VRDYSRLRASLVKARTQIRQGILKLLNAAGVPLGNVLEDVFGASGMGILRALVQGETLWQDLERLVKGKAREHLDAMRAALEVPLSPSQQNVLAFQLQRLARNAEEIGTIEAEIDRHLERHHCVRLGLMTVPGIAEEASAQLLAELGTDLSDFPDAGHFAAWLGLTPGSNQTGGKSKPARTRKGNRQLRALMIESAHAAARTKGCWLKDKFHSVYPRMPFKKAIVVIAHKLALIVYHVIRDGAVYRDQRQDFETGPRKNRSLAQAIRLIQAKGGQVVLPEGFPEIRTRAYRKQNRKLSPDPPKG
jgi:transposase